MFFIAKNVYNFSRIRSFKRNYDQIASDDMTNFLKNDFLFLDNYNGGILSSSYLFTLEGNAFKYRVSLSLAHIF